MTTVKRAANPRYPIPAIRPLTVARKRLQISLAVPGTERKRTRLKAPATATPVPTFPLTSIITTQTTAGSRAKVTTKLLLDECYPRLEVVFGGHDNFREPMVVEADEFIAVKGFKAKGKRLTTYTIETINELEPTRQPEPSQKTEEQETDEEPEILDPDHGKSEGDILDEMTGQMKLF